MRTIPQADDRQYHEWIKVVALVCLGLTLVAAVLDRRNANLDRIEAPPTRPAAPPAPAAMVQEMMAHD